MDPVSLVVSRLSGVKKTSRGWKGICPAHADSDPSLDVDPGDDGRALLTCRSKGCKPQDIVEAIGLAMSDLFPEQYDGRPEIAAEYDYRDEQGALLYQSVRMIPKTFRQRRPLGGGQWEWKLEGVRRVLYRLPELLAAPRDVPVFVVEGEKDVDNLRRLGLVATTNVGGAGKWKSEYGAFLKGRHVVVLPDNDDPGRTHGQAVAESLSGVAASVRVVNLPGLPPKGDVSDWLKAGGTRDQLLVMGPDPKSMARFLSSAERIVGEDADRDEIGRDVLSFGVDFLDDALGGITCRDLVLVGAKSGVGKTALATMAALHNIEQGKRVHYFALEAEDREIERRMKFQVVAQLYFADPNRSFEPRDIRYLDWYMGRLKGLLGAYDRRADEILRPTMQRLHTFYRLDSFTGEDFCARLEEIKDETDLVILDHLHYIDTNDENENRGYKRTVKLIRDGVLRSGKPVIVVAHVRKSDRRNETLVPTQEDFHGSSDVPKIATKAIMLAPAKDQPRPIRFLWPTYMQVVKCRLDSTLTHYAALTQFNLRENRYERSYLLGKFTEGGAVFSQIPEDSMPGWARGRS